MAGKGFITEFKEFISRGNAMNMAVGVIIGGAFQSIVNSLVGDIITPVIGLITGGVDFSKWQIVLSEGENGAVLKYGSFITAVINFLIMAFVIFCFVKLMNKMTESMVKKPQEEAPVAPTTKVCPYCKSEIAIEATKCAFCTSEQPEAENK